jgi:hypothetical protein
MYYLYRLKPSAGLLAALSCCLLLIGKSFAFTFAFAFSSHARSFAPATYIKLCPYRAADLRLFSKTIPSGEDLAGLSRKELQQLAKDNGLKANMKNAEIVASLTALGSTKKAKIIPAEAEEKVKVAIEPKSIHASTTSTTLRSKAKIASMKVTKKTEIEAGSVIASVLKEQGISMADVEQLRGELLSEVSTSTSIGAPKKRVAKPSILAERDQGKVKPGTDPKIKTRKKTNNANAASSKKETAPVKAIVTAKTQKKTTIDPPVSVKKYAISYSQRTPPKPPSKINPCLHNALISIIIS